jgi:integration host factor subunit beta
VVLAAAHFLMSTVANSSSTRDTVADCNLLSEHNFWSLQGGVNMTKADLIEEVSRVVEMTRKESEVIVESIFDSIVKALRGGDKIEIRGFGSFRTRQRQPRIGRNPKTGTRVEVPAKKIPYFKPSKELKDVVNNSAGSVKEPAPAEQPQTH